MVPGNHDARFESNLANNAAWYRNIKGVHLSDHFRPLGEMLVRLH